MQGTWTINVKSKGAAFPQRFIVSGASTGNGTYNGAVGSPAVQVTGGQWTIALQHNPGSGFQRSDSRLKFPSIIGGNYVFDIQSNDSGGDEDFDDLVLTCSRPANENDHLIYGNVSVYGPGCIFNPCRRGWLVIDTLENLHVALKRPDLRKIIEKLYPERIPPVIVNPNPPDPAPFIPLMINLTDEMQLPEKMADVFVREELDAPRKVSKKDDVATQKYAYQRSMSISKANRVPQLSYDRLALAKSIDHMKFLCYTDPGSGLTLSFEEYDRTAAEMSGGPYTGTGNRTILGNTITDMNGNYIFFFTQTFSDVVDETLNDVGAGENEYVAARPDVIVKVNQIAPIYTTVYESAPYFNISQIKRVDICMPRSKVQPSSLCFNGNMIGALGNVFIGGTQNTAASTLPAALERESYGNHLASTGKISVTNSQAGFNIQCAAWYGTIDVKGCLFNTQRKANDPIIRHYTIRYRKPGATWQFVNETRKHPIFHLRNVPGYTGTMTGPFTTNLKVDGVATNVPAYKNIQAEAFYDGIDWEFPNLDCYAQLTSAIYQGAAPGKVYFLVEGYDADGNLVPGARDLIALFIDNTPLGFSLDNVWFEADGVDIIRAECNLYRMKASKMMEPLKIKFKANDKEGFQDYYSLAIAKCGGSFDVVESIPGISSGSNPSNTDANDCPGYKGTAEVTKFGDFDAHEITYTPAASEGGWLHGIESYSMFSVGLYAAKRQTNGYNGGISGTYQTGATFAIEKI